MYNLNIFFSQFPDEALLKTVFWGEAESCILWIILFFEEIMVTHFVSILSKFAPNARLFYSFCRAEDLHGPFGQFGPVKDVYLPRDYYTGYVFFH